MHIKTIGTALGVLLTNHWNLSCNSISIYIFGKVENVSDPTKTLAVRVHDECNGSDVFGSDICTCRPYLTHAIEVCVETAQQGGSVLSFSVCGAFGIWC
jgi:GTP cyclohydrolase II